MALRDRGVAGKQTCSWWGLYIKKFQQPCVWLPRGLWGLNPPGNARQCSVGHHGLGVADVNSGRPPYRTVETCLSLALQKTPCHVSS
jgi:hypothetical protein